MISSSGRNLGEPLCIFFVFSILSLGLCHKGTISEEMPVSMASSTTKRHMFIIQRLNPFIIIVKQTYRIWEGSIQLHLDIDPRIRGVSPKLRFFRYFDELAKSSANCLQRFLIPVFKRQ